MTDTKNITISFRWCSVCGRNQDAGNGACTECTKAAIAALEGK